MQGFRNILIAIDVDRPPGGLIACALRLAKRHGASVRLASVVEDLPWYARLVLPAVGEFEEAFVRDRAATLGRLADGLREEGVEASSVVLRGRRRIELVREAIRGGHDMLMKQAEPNAAVPFGSIDMHLLRTCPCPVWLVKPGQGDRPLTRILVPVDPSPPPDRADLLHLRSDPGAKDPALDAKLLELARSLAEAEGADLRVVHVWSAPGESLARGEPMLSPEQVELYVEDCRAEAEKALKALMETAPDPTGRLVVNLVKGSPPDVIADLAKAESADLIVMGTVARIGIPGLLIGNTAESILQRVECSVLAVKPDGFRSPITPD